MSRTPAEELSSWRFPSVNCHETSQDTVISSSGCWGFMGISSLRLHHDQNLLLCCKVHHRHLRGRFFGGGGVKRGEKQVCTTWRGLYNSFARTTARTRVSRPALCISGHPPPPENTKKKHTPDDIATTCEIQISVSSAIVGRAHADALSKLLSSQKQRQWQDPNVYVRSKNVCMIRLQV